MIRMTSEEIKTLRNALNLTVTELAAKVGVSSDAVRKWERSVAFPSGSATILLRQLQEMMQQNGSVPMATSRTAR